MTSQPVAGFEEVFVEHLHDEVDGAAVGAAHEAAVGVAAGVEREAGVAVVVEGAEGLVVTHLDAEALGNLLYREVAEPLEFVSVHFLSRLRYSSVLL